MRKHITLGLVLSLAMAFSTFALAAPAPAPAGHGAGMQHHGGRSHGHGHGHHGMGFQKLNLTDAQRASVKQIMKDSFAQNRTQSQTLRQQRSAFASMTPDQVGYQAAAARLAQAEGDATRVRVQQKANVRAKIYAVLTPQQKADMATMRTEQQARREKWKEFRKAQPAPSQAAPAAK